MSKTKGQSCSVTITAFKCPSEACLNVDATCRSNARVLADLIQKHGLEKVPPGKTVWFQALGYTIIVRMQRKEPNKDWLQSHPKLRIFDLGISRSKKSNWTEFVAGLYHEFSHIAANIEKIKRRERCGCGDYQNEVTAWALALEMMEQNGIDVESCLPSIGNALSSYANEEPLKVAAGPTLHALGKWRAPLAKHIRKQWLQKAGQGTVSCIQSTSLP